MAATSVAPATLRYYLFPRKLFNFTLLRFSFFSFLNYFVEVWSSCPCQHVSLRLSVIRPQLAHYDPVLSAWALTPAVFLQFSCSFLTLIPTSGSFRTLLLSKRLFVPGQFKDYVFMFSVHGILSYL